MLKRLPSTRNLPVVVYGLDAPDALPAHAAALDANAVTALRDVSIDKIISATLDVTGGGK